MDSTNNDNIEFAPLRQHEKLDVFAGVIEEMKFQEKDVYVYRTALTEVPTEIDITPQRHRDEIGKDIYTYVFSQEEIAEMTIEERRHEVSSEAISVHRTETKEISEARRAYQGVIKNVSLEEGVAYKINRRGEYIMRLHITPKVGLITDFDKGKGHANVLLREGVKIQDLLDPTYTIHKFSYDKDSNE